MCVCVCVSVYVCGGGLRLEASRRTAAVVVASIMRRNKNIEMIKKGGV